MQARESTTGDRLWQTDRYTSGPVLVLRGLVYCTSGDRPAQVVAFDGRSGAVVWSADVGTFDQEARLMTDGRVLLVGLTPERGDAAGALVALSLTDGGRLWRSPLSGRARRGVGAGTPPGRRRGCGRVAVGRPGQPVNGWS